MDEMEFTNDLTKLPIEAQYLKWIILLGSQKKNRLIGATLFGYTWFMFFYLFGFRCDNVRFLKTISTSACSS